MSLAAVKPILPDLDSLHRNELIRSLIEKEEHFERWIAHPTSSIVHHDADCCEEARLWFLAYARSMEIGALSHYELRPPTWLARHFTWGPTEWPISWCQLVKEEVIDCGVFAALAREIFRAQGHLAHPAQALLSYNETCTRHWKELWKSGELDRRKKEEKKARVEGRRVRRDPSTRTFPWIGTEVVYHELCVVEMPDGEARIYDSTWGNWYEPRARVGHGALLALRTDCPRLLRWGGKTISCGEWIDL